MRLAKALGALGAVWLPDVACDRSGCRNARVSASEIKIGQTMHYSGPVSAFGALGKGEVGYFKMVNERGGINGRKINLISLDDSYAPPKTVEQTRRLVESDEVALIFSSIGTTHDPRSQNICRARISRNCSSPPARPQIHQHTQFPQATVGIAASPFRYEARLYARYALAKNPHAKFAVISQNDDFLAAIICWA